MSTSHPWGQSCGRGAGEIPFWQLLVNLYGEYVGFLVDSGTWTSLLSRDCYQHLLEREIKVHLRMIGDGLVHTGGEPLEVYGEAAETFCYRDSGTCQLVTKLYVPLVMCQLIMQYIHGGCMAGHHGVNTTLLEVLWHFY